VQKRTFVYPFADISVCYIKQFWWMRVLGNLVLPIVII